MIAGLLTFLAMGSASQTEAQSVTIALCHVGNPGNPPDPATVPARTVWRWVSNTLHLYDDPDAAKGYGGVAYSYEIGAYDVTLDQYAVFLNAVAKADPYRLYYWQLAVTGNYSGQPTGAGIVQSGAPGGYSYSVIGDSGSDPVTFVSWLDAARFCNWLHNGQPRNLGEAAGSTETGAYTLNGDTVKGLETRNPGAKWWIPSQNEWYKAAYYDPRLNGGAGGYWKYATQSNTPPGNTIGSEPNEANYRDGNQVYCVTPGVSTIKLHTNYLTPVGSFTHSASYYGTYDQNGDVDQWNDAIINFTGYDGSMRRGLRGGSWTGHRIQLGGPEGRYNSPPINKSYSDGFRVATLAGSPLANAASP